MKVVTIEITNCLQCPYCYTLEGDWRFKCIKLNYMYLYQKVQVEKEIYKDCPLEDKK